MNINIESKRNHFIEKISEESGYKTYCLSLQNHMKDKLNNPLEILVIVSGTTGIGKSYTSSVIIADYCKKNPDKRVIALSNRHGNMLDTELLESLNDNALKNKVSYLF